MSKDSHKIKSQKDLKNVPLPPLPFAKDVIHPHEDREKEKKIEKILLKNENLTVEEAKVLLAGLEDKKKKIKLKLDELYEMRGMNSDEVHAYINNSNNFTEQEWKELRVKRQQLVDSFKLTPDLIEIGEKFVSGSSHVSSTKKINERRKGSAQRRGWLPMR